MRFRSSRSITKRNLGFHAGDVVPFKVSACVSSVVARRALDGDRKGLVDSFVRVRFDGTEVAGGGISSQRSSAVSSPC